MKTARLAVACLGLLVWFSGCSKKDGVTVDEMKAHASTMPRAGTGELIWGYQTESIFTVYQIGGDPSGKPAGFTRNQVEEWLEAMRKWGDAINAPVAATGCQKTPNTLVISYVTPGRTRVIACFATEHTGVGEPNCVVVVRDH